MRYITMLSVLVFGLAILFSLVSIEVDQILMVAIGGLLVSIGVLSGK